MKTLLILRHAKSSWNDIELADHDRPLNKRGKRDAPRMGQLLREQGLVPDQIISSTAKRARQTAKRVAKASGYTGKITLTRAFYHASPEAYFAVLSDLPDDYQRVMVVGHNPGMEELVARLTRRPEIMTTAALAHVSLPIEHWYEVHDRVKGGLIHIWRPKELDTATSTSKTDGV
ncbi:MAG: histidine phosphatase family protein [Candidatus Poribacteria bacterium]|nr:histidine phosphatase family protein [Candidatus Poribacteria bacterium]